MSEATATNGKRWGIPARLIGQGTHPVQNRATPGSIPKAVSMRAYEVYCELYGAQEALVTGDCRGGFSGGELFAFLYARSFPKTEWRQRVEEVLIAVRERPIV